MPDWPALTMLMQALLFALPGGIVFLLGVGAIASLFEESEDEEVLRGLAQRVRSDFLRRGRWVSAEQIRQDREKLTRPTYDHESLRN